jgi:hypothetical protein
MRMILRSSLSLITWCLHGKLRIARSGVRRHRKDECERNSRRASGLATSKPALDVSTVAKLRDLASSLDRLCGGEPQVSITNQVGIVCDEATRMRLIKQREELLLATRETPRVPNADSLSKAGWSWGCVSAIDSNGQRIWIADAHRGDGKRFVVHADEKLTAFIELEVAIRSIGSKNSQMPARCAA